jgi:hypothetical protein
MNSKETLTNLYLALLSFLIWSILRCLSKIYHWNNPEGDTDICGMLGLYRADLKYVGFNLVCWDRFVMGLPQGSYPTIVYCRAWAGGRGTCYH